MGQGGGFRMQAGSALPSDLLPLSHGYRASAGLGKCQTI